MFMLLQINLTYLSVLVLCLLFCFLSFVCTICSEIIQTNLGVHWIDPVLEKEKTVQRIFFLFHNIKIFVKKIFRRKPLHSYSGRRSIIERTFGLYDLVQSL